jgi:hypothetical protein
LKHPSTSLRVTVRLSAVEVFLLFCYYVTFFKDYIFIQVQDRSCKLHLHLITPLMVTFCPTSSVAALALVSGVNVALTPAFSPLLLSRTTFFPSKSSEILFTVPVISSTFESPSAARYLLFAAMASARYSATISELFTLKSSFCRFAHRGAAY